MSNMPLCSLGELLTRERRQAEILPDAEYAEIGVYCFGRGIFHKPPRTGLEVGNKKLYLIKEGDFILQSTFAWEGAVGLASAAEDGMYGSNRFLTFRVNEERCYPSYLLYYFKTEAGREQLDRISPGSAGRNRVLGVKRIPEVSVPLPPLSEQRRIVARIEELAAKIEEARGLRQQTNRSAVAMWSAGLTKCFGFDSQAQMTLEDACGAIIDNLHSTPRYDGNEFPCLRSQDVGWGTINYAQAQRTSYEEFLHRTRRGEPQKGDIIFIREGDVGRCGVVDGLQRFSLGQRVMMFRPNTEIVLSRYLMFQIMSPPVLQDQILEGLKGTTSHHVNIKYLKKVKVIIPPLEEQHHIVAYLNNLQAKVDALKRLQAETAAELDALMLSILDKAFKGEL